MNKKSIRNLTIAGVSCAGLGVVAIATTAVSCSATPSKVVQINAKYANQKAKLQNEFGLPKYVEGQPYDTTGAALVKNANDAVTELNKFKSQNESKLSIDEKIWLDSYIYNWKTEINNWNNGLQYLGGNPSGDALPLNPNSNHLDDNIISAINIYQIDEETLEPIEDANHIDKNLAKNYPNVGQALCDYINALQEMLTKGMEKGVMPNNITKKLFVNQMLSNYYPNELLFWVGQSGATSGVKIALPVSNSSFTPTNALLNNFDAWSTWAKKNGFNQKQIDDTKTSLLKSQKELDEFINWYANDYFTNNKSYGTKTPISIESLLITSAQKQEERTISITKNGTTTKIYGLGITNDELNLPKIGLGFMNSTLQINNKSISGNDMYQALLKFNNSVNKTSIELVQTGISFVETTTKNMKEIAKQVALLNNPGKNDAIVTWAPNVLYDNDITDNEKPKQTQMNIYSTQGKLNFAEFNKWLNQEDFFFGRETNFWNQNYNSKTTNLIAYTSLNTNKEFKKYLETLTTLGYAGPNGIWNSNQPIYGVGSVKGQQALAGAVLSLVDYNNFKNETKGVFDFSFKSIPEYNVAPYNQKIQEIIGVGLEGPRGSNIFNYNVNPYFSLPKWSQSSFQNHEGKMGHHTQQAYWTKYMPNGDGANQSGPGYVFKQDAFHEGWAVFAEWYANELNVYGSDLDSTTRIPTNWLNENGFVPNIKNEDNPTNDEINAIKNFQAGAYWQAASGATSYTTKSNKTLSGEQAQAVAATKIANMLQYYGYLNEAQLRNMRLAVDPLYHYNDGNTSNSNNGTVSNQNSTDAPSYGASINQIRTYLKNNSGLGQGDIQSESYRYLNMPSQATGYMTGKVIFENCYKAVKQQYETNNNGKQFLSKENQKGVQKLFDLMLRNGEIPLQVLEDAVKEVYGISQI